MKLPLAQFGVVVKVSARELVRHRRLDRIVARRRQRLRKRMDEAIAEVFAPKQKSADIEIDRPAGSGGFMFPGQEFPRAFEREATRQIQAASPRPIHSEDCT